MSNIEKARIHFKKALEAYENEDYITAKEKYEKAIEIDSSNVDAYNNLADLLTTHFQQYKEAKEYYEKALGINPKSSETYGNYATLLSMFCQKYKQAKQYFEKAIVLNPKNFIAYNNLAYLLTIHFQDYQNARKYYEKAIKIKPDSFTIYNGLANLLAYHLKEYDKAKECYEKAIGIDPLYADAYSNLAVLLTDYFEEYKEAKQYYEKALDINPNLFMVHHNLAILLFDHFSNTDDAKLHFLRAIEINDKSEMSRLGLNEISIFKEQTYITEFNIKKVRHLTIPSILLSDTEKKHLIFTGKNGSGKTSVLNEAKEYFEKILEMPIDKLFTEAGKKEFLSEDGDYKLQFNVKTDLLTLRLKYETGNFIAAHFPARRRLSLGALERLPKNINIPLTAKISDRLNDDLIDYYWNIKTQALLALENEDLNKKKKLDQLINAFVEKFKIIDSRIKKVEFTAENGKYNIEFIPESPYEKFDFSTLADGYASIFDFISEIILRMSNRTNDVFNLEGIVLIDEPETHLHIDMQKQVLPMLSKFFPNVQFVVATHSPYVINSVENSVVYDLETGIRTEKLSKIPIDNITDYLQLTKDDVKNIEAEITEFIDLVGLLKKGKVTDKDGNRIAELDLKLNKIVPKISDESFRKFKEAQKYLY